MNAAGAKHCWLLVALLLLLPSVSAAHGMLLRAQPPVDSDVDRLPETIRLWFNERVEGRFSRVTVHRAQRDAETGELAAGERIDDGMADTAAITQEIAVRLPETLPAGLYLVQWRVLSVDSHRTTGRFTLTYRP
jgi:methionine-rich copper-binding protein CopC